MKWRPAIRKALVDTLCELAGQDDRVVLLTADLGFLALEPFREQFPQRFFNVGVSEQNMIGMATGLAEAGLRPYAYSIAPFASLRPFEFIRNGPVSHKLDVRIVGMGMGFEYGHSGHTHYGLEDVAVMRTLPGLTVVVPADSRQAATALRKTYDLAGPIYYSLGKNDAASVPQLDGRFELGKIQVVQHGRDLLILTMGSISVEVAVAAEKLAAIGVNATIAVVSSFSPDPIADLAELLQQFPICLTVEAQTTSGGLGAFAATVIASHGLRCRLRIIGVQKVPDGTSGSESERWAKHGLDRHTITDTVLSLLGRQST